MLLARLDLAREEVLVGVIRRRRGGEAENGLGVCGKGDGVGAEGEEEGAECETV